MKPVLVQLVQRMSVGGLETMALTLGARLEAQFEVHYLSLEGETGALIDAWPRLANLGHFKALNKGSGVDARLIQRLRRYFKQHKVTHLHSHHIGPLIYGGAAAFGLGVTHVHTHHDGWSLTLGRQKQLTRAAETLFRPAMVADADTVADAYQGQGCRIEKVIPNGVAASTFLPADQQAARRRFGLPARALLLGTACRLEPVKGVDRLLSLLTHLPEEVHLVIAGEGGEKPQLQAMAQHLKVAQRCHFLGQVERMEQWYPALDLFCLASHSEGAPMSLLEAQACEVPVMVPDVGNCRNMVCTEMGHVLDVAEVESWVRPVRRLMALSRQRRGALRRFVLSSGSDDAMAQQYLSLMEERS
ncbi:glycosyltransferase [Ferrimonas sp. YFM]|uniref:glycosyltransferase n=1 Tax=Ferrimonas sp. YFM TaxID=3028878 RepID=UPI002572A00B|nr:glycosyltransferase [Ferrimonas sp. YFM]BDY04927.1 glycosyl transferase [Ferrimonas sp. YFM]